MRDKMFVTSQVYALDAPCLTSSVFHCLLPVVKTSCVILDMLVQRQQVNLRSESGIYAMQDVFNLLPNLSVEELLRSFAIKSNDMMLAVYLASMIRRSVTSCTYSTCELTSVHGCSTSLHSRVSW